jgi:hypothetical protein
VKFQSPTRLPRALWALAHNPVVTADRSYPLDELAAVAVRVEASSFSPAMPPTCHKERARAVTSGQSRSVREGC